MTEFKMLRPRSDRLSVSIPLAIITLGSAFSLTLKTSAKFFTLGQPAKAQSLNWTNLEDNIIREHNRVRQNPRSYIPLLENLLSRMNDRGDIVGGCGPNCNIITREGKPAVREAIKFLSRQRPLGSLNYSPKIARAAKIHALDQANGAIGHVGRNGSMPLQRLQSTGVRGFQAWGENIEYGGDTAQRIVMNLIIDDGVSNRGHRTTIFSPSWTSAGAGCGSHARFRSVCVVNYIQSRRANAVDRPGQANRSVDGEIETTVGSRARGDRNIDNGDRAQPQNRGFLKRVADFFNVFGF